ncbi:hypothetical protein [Parabacteroides sp.]
MSKKNQFNEMSEIAECFFKMLVIDLKSKDLFSGIYPSNNPDDYEIVFPYRLDLDEINFQYKLANQVLNNLDVESISLRLIKCEDVHYIAVKTWI